MSLFVGAVYPLSVNWTVYESVQINPARNLAMEDALLEGLERGTSIFLLYRDAPCVVIGRNQNPWVEAAPGTGLPIFRRRSGGGAVYHDEGNLNWSILAPRDDWSVQDALDMVSSALRGVGVETVGDARGALFLEGRKVCGTARRYFRASVLIHGTLLITSDLSALRSSLGGLEAAELKSIASVSSPVGSLSEAVPDISVRRVADALLGEVYARVGSRPAEDPERFLDLRDLELREREHRSWDWIYGSTLPFSVPLDDRGEGYLLLVRSGRVWGVRKGGLEVDLGAAFARYSGLPFNIETLQTARDLAAAHADRMP